MEYVVTGLTMLDKISINGQNISDSHLGGVPLYGYCGIRPYTKNVLFLSRVGRDFKEVFHPWFSDNEVLDDGLIYVSDKTPYNVIDYDENGNVLAWEFLTGHWEDSDYWRPHAQDFETAIAADTKCLYLSETPVLNDMWDKIFELKDAFGFKVMWEPNGIHSNKNFCREILDLSSRIEMVSFNVSEAKDIFSIDDEQELLEFLKKLPCELVLLRVGKRGLYTVSDGKICYVPSAPVPDGCFVVDVTGCGNCSTAAAAYAWCEGNDMAMTGIMANVASGYNLRQNGPIPRFSDEVCEEIKKAVDKLYSLHSYQYIS